jgi:phosphomannomutase
MFKSAAPQSRSAPSFLDYEPVELQFGTSGMRGLVRDITDLEAYISVKGALEYLLRIGDIARGSAIVVGGDLRPSTDRIVLACVQAILDSGCRVEYAGKLPTPALVLHAIETGRAGVMVTGSHIPFDRNGIKVNRSRGELLKSDEPGVLAEIARERATQYAKTAATSAFDASGMLKQAPALPPRSNAAEERFSRRYIGAFPDDVLAGRRIAFWEHSAVGRELIPLILMALGAEVVRVGRSDSFVPIDTENIDDAALGELERLVGVAEAQHGPIDAIVSTDGDSDRPLVAAVRRRPSANRARRVRFIPGDLLGLVVADYLRADAVTVPVSANDAIDQHFGQHLGAQEIELTKTRIGSPYVIASMDEQRRRGAERVVGWEANGGFLVGSDLRVPGGTLRALPTRDSLLPIVATFAAASARSLTVEELWDRLPARFGRAGLIDEIPVAVSGAIMRELVAMAPAELEPFFGRALGFGKVARRDSTDGVRIWFDNGDIAHLRPSGNAPQLRIYANAGSQARADEIVAHGLREPDGILRALQRAFG